MEFDVKKYINLINEYKFNEADEYRISNVPKKLYKFIYLSELQECKSICRYKKINDIKIKSIQENKFWLSTYERLNDPFELKTLYVNEKTIKKYNYPMELIRELQEQYLNGFLIGCFTANKVSNCMPMWAHYANNHRGFCIEYKINKPKFFYPISYEPGRAQANVLYMNTINLIMKDLHSKLTSTEKLKLNLYRYLFFHNSIIKHKSWEYENEWRLLFPNIVAKKDGALIDNNMLGIEISGIYLGMCCEEIYSNRLKEIGKSLGINVYRMNFENEKNEYLLSYNKV
ncbi:DUF2971 domain-containing protein [Clostridium perfringens]|uniref:DUF2971 domain-containing protein n=1 Tax=Clostridium perfringens TaxID=1502 RepID=UPI001ABB2356|nr:DUF2971 domain-containing protein [Clostridium perfringens]MBO3373924.1 DUF2971 domain-containing protein [Clostridium perfringens]MDK0955778.1 DUF2971 domain-containing protein [Clostridium perfringens]MDT7982208.1 DUF2971 domain-containing protein [Clostridium perfringens]